MNSIVSCYGPGFNYSILGIEMSISDIGICIVIGIGENVICIFNYFCNYNY